MITGRVLMGAVSVVALFATSAFAYADTVKLGVVYSRRSPH